MNYGIIKFYNLSRDDSYFMSGRNKQQLTSQQNSKHNNENKNKIFLKRTPKSRNSVEHVFSVLSRAFRSTPFEHFPFSRLFCFISPMIFRGFPFWQLHSIHAFCFGQRVNTKPGNKFAYKEFFVVSIFILTGFIKQVIFSKGRAKDNNDGCFSHFVCILGQHGHQDMAVLYQP